MNREQIAYLLGYRVTKDGNLLNPKGIKLGCVNHHGYEQTGLNVNKKHKNIFTHRLQAYQKYGNKLFEDGIVVRHLNGNKIDNSWDNISIGTQRDNILDIPKEKRKRKNLNANKSHIKYPKSLVYKLREEYNELKSYKKLSVKYNIPMSSVQSLIKVRKVFKDA